MGPVMISMETIMSELHFECKKCRNHFDGDVGRITFSEDIYKGKQGERPEFENEVICPSCGVLTLDEVELTELGQTQLTEIFWNRVIAEKGARPRR